LNTKATALRSSYTKQAYNDFLDAHPTEENHLELIENTLFKKFIDSGDLNEGEIARFAYNVFVTRRILESLYDDISTIEGVFLISKVVEQGYFKLVKDFETLTLKNNLAIAKEFGAFFTPLKIAREMAKLAVESSRSKVIIDPCCGTGNLLAACLEYSSKSGIQIKKLIGVELDELSASICKKILDEYKTHLGLDVEIEVIASDSLSMLSSQGQLFDHSFEPGTFIINPPYGKLKFDSDRAKNNETNLSIKDDHIDNKKAKTAEWKLKIKGALSGLGIGKGAMEWSKVFLVLCSNNLDKDESLIFIGPCGWLNSVSQSEIRKDIFNRKLFNSIHFISETNTGFETVNQPLALVCLKQMSKNKSIKVSNDFEPAESVKYSELEILKKYNYPIPRISFDRLKVFIKLQSYKKIRDVTGIRNLRGELDQSLNKSILTTKKTSLKVVRGKDIGRYMNINDSGDETYYADKIEFFNQLSTKPKGSAHKNLRIVGRQCSYMKQERRLIFDVVPPNSVVGNSCNYMTVEDDADIYFYLALLNSALMDWYFRVLNGNNHVANYEIDDFPVPDIDKRTKAIISKQVEIIKAARGDSSNVKATTYFEDEYKLDALIFKAFKLTRVEVRTIMTGYSKKYIDQTIEVINDN
jgi:Type I restriction-modification system methyltransferase subunit